MFTNFHIFIFFLFGYAFFSLSCKCERVFFLMLCQAFSFWSATNTSTDRNKGSNSVKVNKNGIYIVVWNEHTDGKRENKQILVAVSFELQLQPASMRMHSTYELYYVCDETTAAKQPSNKCENETTNTTAKKIEESTKWYMLFHMSILRTIITINFCFSKRNGKLKNENE